MTTADWGATLVLFGFFTLCLLVGQAIGLSIVRRAGGDDRTFWSIVAVVCVLMVLFGVTLIGRA